MAAPTIKELEDELMGLIQSVPSFGRYVYSIFDVEDLLQQSELATFPTAGVSYDGAVPVARVSGNEAVPVAVGAGGAANITLQFTVILAVQYHYGGQSDTKPQATDLLGEVRTKVIGFRGVNTKPWVFFAERPEPRASGDGLVFYSQVWHTSVPVVGNVNNV